ncbi:16S rRNA (guanine(527)-N(7))-methyltransferase RsmG [Rhodoblastus acidophilus]|jgi:16S rRNA (guanine527-N7)-methyltransferase|uniref:Ribosomal RNA small subunit methyltransferase G n=1 Tax=Rhodoblastus acidophilus TaxID=1074 RepID=A0A6N8DNB9_RHOAC|nr:16S rRNA (guanine(527)-N(7))-methyltransferase RsmG [Rhodoblastus acidophilus]MCW2274122.1 16S rRNA (guanine527-N7)-methyltransferase [Rhodoblastus acidophilus]MTV30693.1 16S rRNA (guanine(527)-N(7))-methyltransferase RsmG [Rhodoblastus acidophilus]
MADADRAPELASIELTAEQIAKLKIYESLLAKWQRRLNLVARSTISQIWPRHFEDSLQLLPLAGNWRRWVDIGSGAGFPGMVIAIMSPSQEVHLVESDRRKAAFLGEVSRETDARAYIHVDRIERALPELATSLNFDIISARALAPIGDLLRYAEPVLQKGARGLFLKGKELARELTDSPVNDTFSYELVNSATERDAKIVVVHHLKIPSTHRLEQ